MISDKTMSITLGYRCTMSCNHCLNHSGPSRQECLDETEILKLRADIIQNRPGEIILIGGEPTLYIKIIIRILKNLPYNPFVTVTTNGYFATKRLNTEKILNQIPYLRKIQLSFDRFHSSDIGGKIPFHLNEYSKEKRIDFTIIVCTNDFKKDLLFFKKISLLFPGKVIYQEVDGSGRAKETDSEYQYPEFEPTVLEKKCPNNKTINYFPGKGYSVCCANVVFNLDSPNIFEQNIKDLKTNAFRENVTKYSIKQRLDRLGCSIPKIPRLSSVCNFCELLAEKENF